jgi:hypothetical protein
LVLLCVNGHFGQWAAQLYKVVPVLHQWRQSSHVNRSICKCILDT